MSVDHAEWLASIRAGVADAAPRAGAFARDVRVVLTTTSTSDDVARASGSGASEGCTVIAAMQTAGRGRRGATWESPAGAGLYLSTLLRPAQWHGAAQPGSASLVTMMAGATVAMAAADVGAVGVEVKWPNDVMVRSASSDGPAWRKLAGVLAEGVSVGGALETVVLGIGVNVADAPMPPAVAARRVTLTECVDRPPRVALVRALVTVLLTRLREGVDLLASGASARVLESWLQRSPSAVGTRVSWSHEGRTCEGVTAGIAADGALRVRRPGGEIQILHGGTLEWHLEARP